MNKILGLGVVSLLITFILSNTIANANLEDLQRYAEKFKYSTQDLQLAYDYCIQHANEIVAGKNPVEDLVASKLISPDFGGLTCDVVKTEKDKKQNFDDLMNKFSNLD